MSINNSTIFATKDETSSHIGIQPNLKVHKKPITPAVKEFFLNKLQISNLQREWKGTPQKWDSIQLENKKFNKAKNFEKKRNLIIYSRDIKLHLLLTINANN